jgi:hypothetical protein
MTDIDDITKAIKRCNEVKARLETLRDMANPKPVLRLESITRPGTYRELRSADALADCYEGTIIVASNGRRYLRTDEQKYPWATSYGTHRESDDLWRSLVCSAECGTTFKYLAAD